MLTEQEIGSILATQLVGLSKDRTYSYVSSTPTYSHLEEPGKKIMAELVDMLFVKAVQSEKKRKQDEAEQLVMENLKK